MLINGLTEKTTQLTKQLNKTIERTTKLVPLTFCLIIDSTDFVGMRIHDVNFN